MKTKLFVYMPFDENKSTFEDAYKGIYTKVYSYSVTSHDIFIGEFSLVLNANADISPDDILRLVDGIHEHWLIVRKLEYDDSNKTVTVTGTDLKGLLAYRTTLYADEAQDVGTFGYDVVQGYTGACCAHYVRNNCTEPRDAERIMHNLVIDDSSLFIGAEDSTYKARFEPVSDVVQKLCENAGVCWDIVGDLANDCYCFRVFAPVDRSAEQTDREQVVFSVNRKNVLSFRREIGNTELKNAFYATKSGGTLESDAYTAVVYRDEENVPSGYARKEMQLNVSCEDYSEVDTYALYNAQDYVDTDSISAQTSPTGFDTDFFVGDRVSVYDSTRGAILSTPIKTVTISRSSSDYQLSLTFGKASPKVIKKILNKINNGVK